MASAAERVRAAAREALASGGWELTGPSVLCRGVEHETPAGLPERWWPAKTYRSVEIVSFTFFGDGKVSAYLALGPCPWVGTPNRAVSLKRALAVLATPAGEAEIHRR